jgi:diguanylate cyclase (GGDEF)-like protein
VPLRRPNLLVAFGVMSAVPVLLLAIVLTASLRGIIRDRSLAGAQNTAGFVSTVGLPAYLSEEEIRDGLEAKQVRLLDSMLGSGAVGDDLSGIEIRNASGTLVYAKDAPASARGAPTEDFGRALRGESVSRVTDLRGHKTLMVAVPVTYLGRLRPAGVVTIYLAYDSIEQSTAADVRKLYMILIGGLALFYVLLFPFVARASNTLRRQAAENERLARQDALTGLPNRIVFRDELEAALRQLDSSGAAVVVMVVDIDRFKDVNDRLGHHNGDVLIRTVGDRLRKSLREVDVVARIGGDQFGVLMPRANASFSQEIASRLRAAIGEPVTLEGTRLASRRLASRSGTTPRRRSWRPTSRPRRPPCSAFAAAGRRRSLGGERAVRRRAGSARPDDLLQHLERLRRPAFGLEQLGPAREHARTRRTWLIAETVGGELEQAEGARPVAGGGEHLRKHRVRADGDGAAHPGQAP